MIDKAKIREDLRHMMRNEWKRTWRFVRSQLRLMEQRAHMAGIERDICREAERNGFYLWMVRWFLEGSNFAAWQARKHEVACNRVAAAGRPPGTPRVGRVTSQWMPGLERTVTRRAAVAEWMTRMGDTWRIARVLTPFRDVARNSRVVYWFPKER